jgi:hypothetical protein
MKIILFFFAISYCFTLLGNELNPFITDYCTMFVNGTREKPTLWKHCCLDHDMNYWYGGSENNMDTADLRLRSCVTKVAGENWGNLIYKGVRLGHMSPIKNPRKWNWGWVSPRPEVELTPLEKKYVIEELKRLPFPRETIDNYIKNNF